MQRLVLYGIVIAQACAASSMDSFLEQARAFAESQKGQGLQDGQQLDPSDLLPESLKGQQFDPSLAYEQVRLEEDVESEIATFIQSPDLRANEERWQASAEDQALFAQLPQEESDHEAADKDQLLRRKEKCLVARGPREIKTIRHLEVTTRHKPAVYAQVKHCLRHEFKKAYYLKKNARRKKESLEAELLDPSIESRWIEMNGQGGLTTGQYLVKAKWRHVEDTASCDSYYMVKTQVEEEEWVEEDRWKTDDERVPALLASPSSSLIARRCLDRSPREREGRELDRPCWVEELTFACSPEKQKTCPFFRDPRCQLVHKKCLSQGQVGCAVWEYLFDCDRTGTIASHLNAVQQPDAIDDVSPIESAETSLSEVATKLSAFQDIDRQLRTSGSLDASSIPLFSGKIYRCSKSVASDAFYDCCFAKKGLAQHLKLAQCNPEEIDLADRRERGLSHYIGRQSKEFAGLFKSRDEHVFCCFPSKLARVFQEKAREQLGIDWGSAKEPECRGLFQSEIARVDFAKLDLSDLYDQPMVDRPEQVNSRVGEFAQRVARRLREARERGLDSGIHKTSRQEAREGTGCLRE